MQVIRHNVYSELDEDDILALEMLVGNLYICRNENLLNCKDCPFENVGDACIPSLAEHILKRHKGVEENEI